jgi:hypothetical protein
LEHPPNEVLFTSIGGCETTEEMVVGARQNRNVKRTRLAPTDIGAITKRSAVFTSLSYCEMAEVKRACSSLCKNKAVSVSIVANY